MTYLIHRFHIFIISSLFVACCYGQEPSIQELSVADTYNPNDWTTIKLPSTYRDSAPKKMESDEREGLAYSFDATPIQGQWLRISTSSIAAAPDIKIATTFIDNTKARYTKTPPTQCIIKTDIKICINNIWVAKSIDTIGVRFSWSKSKNFRLNSITYEMAKQSVLDATNEDRYKKLIAKMSQHYYRSNEVDWKSLYVMGQQALTAPASIDPLPGAMIEVINRLPGNQETFIFNNPIPNKKLHSNNSTDENSASDYLPGCEPINTSTWRLNLPGTLTSFGNNWLQVTSNEYVEAAHKCLSKIGITKWVVNLTTLKNGDYIAPLAALAPLIGNGPVITQKSTSNDIKVFIDNLTIHKDDKTLITWQNQPSPFNGQIDFILGENCGYEVCGTIWLAIKEHGRTIGFQANSIFVNNMDININQTMHLQLTYQELGDANGKLFTKINPDVVVDTINLKKALNNQLQ